MIDVHFAIDFTLDGKLNQRWHEAAIEAHLEEVGALDDPIEGAVAIGEAEIIDTLFSAVLRLCFQCLNSLIVPDGVYRYRYEAANAFAQLQTSGDGTTITIAGSGLSSQTLPTRELLPALYACGVRYIELLERLESRGRPCYDLPHLDKAAAAARTLLERRGWI
jgi:hypothetical protein